VALFEFRAGSGIAALAPYTATADGRRFLLNTIVDHEPSAALTVVVNWTADVKR